MTQETHNFSQQTWKHDVHWAAVSKWDKEARGRFYVIPWNIYFFETRKKKKPVKLLFSLPINTLMHTCKYYANGMLIGGVAAKQPCCSNDWWENRWGQSQAVKAAPTQINKTLGD